MKLNKLVAKNFMPYKEPLELEFPQNENQNVVVVFGDNMRGKTSILNAIRWALYGEVLGRHSKSIPIQEIINKDATLEDDWSVEVHLSFQANGNTYDLRRTAERKPLIVNPRKPEDFSQNVHLKKNGIVVQGDTIETEIGLIAPRQISRFFLFDGELLQEYESLLMEESDQGKQIKEAIEQVLGVPALTNGRDDIQAILKKAVRRQQQDLRQVAGLERQAELRGELLSKQDSYEQDIKDLTTKIERIVVERNTLNDELKAVQRITKAQTTLDLKEQEVKELADRLKVKEAERLELISSAWKDLLDIKLEMRRKQLEEEQSELTDRIKHRTGLEKKAKDLEYLLEKKECPTCSQKIAVDLREKFGASLGKIQSKLQSIDDSTEALNRVSGKFASLSKIRSENTKDRLKRIESELREGHVRLVQLENEIESLKDEVASYDTAEIARKRVLLDEKTKEEGRLRGHLLEQKAKLKAVKDQLDVTQKAIESLAQSRELISTKRVSLCTDLEKVFKESIERLRDKLRKKVEDLANQAFKEMTTQKKYKGLTINDNYGLQIIDASGRHVALRSAGAEQVVALSLIDGLNRTGRSAGPVIMDTPFGRLDVDHRENILKYMPTVTNQFVLLVHSGEIRKQTDLGVIADRIGAVYEIKEVSSTQSRLERSTL